MGFEVLVAAIATAASAQPQGPLATIEGGVDETGHEYTWIVKNLYASPIVSIEIPHYRADEFTAPQGWEKDCTNIIKVGAKDAPGRCIARVSSAAQGIERGVSAKFGMRIAPAGALNGTGTVTVTFADGTTFKVVQVELPQQAQRSVRFVPLIGLGGIFALVVLINLVRRRKRSGVNLPPAEGAM